jgi:hypothetical protein
MARLLWTARGERKLPSSAAFDRAASRLASGELDELCELNPIAPIYLIPTRPFLRALARRIRSCGARRVLEVAAGEGHLSRFLAAVAPDLQVTATVSFAWEKPEARMNAREKRDLRSVAVAGLRPGPDVLRMGAVRAVRELRPDLVLCSWLPPGPLLLRIIRAAPQVLEIGAGSGITGDIRAWRYEHEFCEELEALGRCRLDERPTRKLHTTVTLYRR